MYFIYLTPYVFLTSILGVVGAAVACLIIALGTLRLLFLSIILLTGDTARFKSEQTEGWSIVVEKWNAVVSLFKRAVQ